MGFKIKNSLTGEFEKLPILTLKGEKGETGGVEEYNKVDYMGNKYETLKQANDANVEYAVKTAIGEFNYLDYDGQHITATETIEGRAKSAILSGNTLVNLFNVDDSLSAEFSNSRWKYQKRVHNLIGGNKYYVYFFNKLNNLPLHIKPLNTAGEKGAFNVEANTGKVVTLDSTITNAFGYYYFKDGWTGEETKQDIIDKCKILFIEYQEGMENWDIPYFEGMQSVKMPVLTTTGKNLLNPNYLKEQCLKSSGYSEIDANGNIVFHSSAFHQKRLIALDFEPNTQYAFNLKMSGQPNSQLHIIVYYTDSTKTVHIPYIADWTDTISGITKANATVDYITISYGNGAPGCVLYVNECSLFKSDTVMPHEPYKSNILSTSEDVVLRGIGDAQDTLDISTGEKVERIGEIMLDGSENWTQGGSQSEGLVRFYTPPTNKKHATGKVMSSDITPYNGTTPYGVVGYENITGYSHNIHLNVNIKMDRIGVIDLTNVKQNEELFKLWLSQNPITVQYELETPIVKTVDLSDNHVYSYENITHYDCSSAEGSLVPTLSVKVPTDVQATIAQQRETIQTLNSENERLNQIQEALKASMLDSQVQLMNLSWDTDFEVFTLRESIAPKDFPMDLKTGSNIDKFSQAKFIIENDCPDLEKLNSQIEYYFSKDIFSQEQFEELTDLISIVKGENSCEY